MDANEQKARELLAAEYDRDGMLSCADSIRHEPQCLATYDDRTIRAIMAALAQQVPADGEVAGVRDTLIVAANNPVSHGGLEGLRKIMRAQAARLAATPQAPQPVVDGMKMIESAWLDRLTRFIGPGAMAYLSRLHSDAAALAAHGKPND